MAELIGPVTGWAKSALEDCFNGADLDFYGDFYLEGDSSGYAEEVTVNGRGASIHGRLDVDGDIVHRIAMAIRIESAESMADLPEGLTNEDEDMRDLAKDKLEELGFDTDEE